MNFQSGRDKCAQTTHGSGPRAAARRGFPPPQGLYDPVNEHDACGIGFVANMHGKKSHELVGMGLEILTKLDHRGAVGADPTMGDGAGILIQIPHALFKGCAEETGITLPEFSHYGVGNVFLPRDKAIRATCEAVIERFRRSSAGETYRSEATS
jgi:glutamate synthase (NADPH/NADH) large chain